MGLSDLPFWIQAIFMALFVLLFDRVFRLGITAVLTQYLFVGGIVLFFVMVILITGGMELFHKLGLLSTTGSGMRTSYRFKKR